MAQHDLQIAHKGPTVKGVAGVRMSQVVGRKPIQVTAASSLFDGALDIVFVATSAHLGSSARMIASGDGLARLKASCAQGDALKLGLKSPGRGAESRQW